MKRRDLISLTLASAAVAAAAPVLAQEWPAKPLRLVVPYPAGGSTDVLGRLLAQKLEGRLGQTVVVENIAGANGSLGARAVATSPADGYSLLLANMGILTINPHIYKNMGFQPKSDLEPLRIAATALNLLTVRPDLQVSDTAELIKAAKAARTSLTYASAGNGSSQHLAGALFERAAGVKMVHVPYRGGTPAITDMLAGRVDMMFGNLPEMMPWVREGKLKAVALGSDTAVPALPGIKPISATVKGFEISNWYGVLARAGTPEPVLAKLDAALVQVLGDSEVQARLNQLMLEPQSVGRKEFRNVIAKDDERWGRIVAEAGIRVE